MSENLKRLTAEARAAIVESVAKQACAGVIAATKAASDEDAGTFKVIVSTANTDRQGDSINQNGWDLSYFKNNPVVLWAHDYGSLPIGVCTAIDVVDGKLTAEGKFAPAEANPFAQQVRKLYDLGMIKATSVGFIPKTFDENNSAIILEQELLEFSFVPVPANPHALRIDMIKDLGIDLPMLATKGIEVRAADDDTDIHDEPDGDENMPEHVKETLDNFKSGMVGEHADHKANHHKAIEDFKAAMKTIDVSKSLEGETKSIDIEKMECFKAFVTAHDLEHERHSKAVDEHIAKLSEAVGNYEDETEDKAVPENVKAIIRETSKSTIISLLAQGNVKLPDGTESGRDAGIKPRSRSLEALDELNDFVEARTLLKSIDNAVEKVLRRFNESAKRRSAAK